MQLPRLGGTSSSPYGTYIKSCKVNKIGSNVNDNAFHYLGIMDIRDFSPHIFWSYDRGADIEPEVVIRQVIAYGEVRDMMLLVKRINRERILEVIGNWKEQDKHYKRIHFFTTVILESSESGN